jgi:hypothetical protein
MASEPFHGLKRRAAANTKLVGTHEQPLPNDIVAVTLPFMDIKS